jgi:iron complex outermembrane receptor protein
MKRIHAAEGGVVLFVFIALFCADSYAQTSSGDTPLEEVVVTAQRRTTDIQSTALAVSVLTGDLLEEKGITNLEFIQYAAPSVKISNYGSANVFNIRGVGRSQVDIDVPSGVVIYRDGAPTIAGYFQGEPYYDIDSIEVLRGPQGTFVGKSASGGAVFINTKNPVLGDSISGSVEGGGGNNDMKEFTGIANVPVNDTLALRASYRHLDSNDFYKSITGNFTGHPGERNMNSFRGAVLWQPVSDFEALVKVDYHDLDFGGNVVSSYGFPLYRVEQNGNIAYHDKSTRVVGNLSYKFNNGITLKSLSAYQYLDSINNLDLDASLPLFYQFKSSFTVDIISEELNLISPEDQRLRWVLGFLYFQQEADVPYWQKNGFTFTGGGFGTDYPWLTSPWFKHEDEWSVFAHLAYDLTDKIELEIGGRYSDYYTDQFTDWTFGDGTFPPTLQFAPPGKQKFSQGSVDGEVGVNYSLNNDHFLYALVSRGHTVGGINIFPPFRIYSEMQVINYEGGWKANWFDDQIRTQATIFYQDFDNYQVNFEQLAAFGAPGQDNRNAPGKSKIYGFELSAQAHLNNLHVDYNLSLLQSDIGKFQGVVDPIQGTVVDLSGIDIPFVADVSTNLGVAYDFHIPAAGGFILTPRFDIAYTSAVQSKLWRSPIVKLGSRTLANVNLMLMPANEKWSVSFWMTNAFDREYVAAIQNLGTLRYAGRPQEFGARLKYNF